MGTSMSDLVVKPMPSLYTNKYGEQGSKLMHEIDDSMTALIEKLQTLEDFEPNLSKEIKSVKNMLQNLISKSNTKEIEEQLKLTKLTKLQEFLKSLAAKAKTKKGVLIIASALIILAGIITSVKLYQKYHMVEKHSKYEHISVHIHNE